MLNHPHHSSAAGAKPRRRVFSVMSIETRKCLRYSGPPALLPMPLSLKPPKGWRLTSATVRVVQKKSHSSLLGKCHIVRLRLVREDVGGSEQAEGGEERNQVVDHSKGEQRRKQSVLGDRVRLR